MENSNLENILNNIKNIIKDLEKEDIGIDEAVKLFEEGTKYIKTAELKINNIKEKVVKIINDNK